MDCVTHEAGVGDARLSFDEIFALHHKLVFRVAYGLVRNPALAEEVTQEVFLKFYRNMGESAPGDEYLRAWLLRVCVNVSRNTLRGNNRAVTRETKFVDATLADVDGGGTPAEDYERRVEIEAARRALDKVGEPSRSCLLLQQQGLGYREIAAALSLNEKSVGSLIARGRKKFARVYGKVGGIR